MKQPSTITNRSRLLCPDCDELRRVKEVMQDDETPTIVYLACGHFRGELLPLKAGRISIENLNTAQGRTCFPAMRIEWN
jgi:hypothetical protein